MQETRTRVLEAGARKLLAVSLTGVIAMGAGGQVADAASRLPTVDCFGEGCAQRPLVCSWPFLVTAETLNLAYPDPNATYWATPFQLGSNESLELRGRYPSARFMAVTLYDAGGSLIDQLSDFEIPPTRASENPFATDPVSPLAGDRWRIRIVPDAAPESGPGTLHLDAGQVSGWLVYRVYLGNPAGDLSGGVALPTIALYRGGRRVRAAAPCKQFLPGTTIADLLQSQMPDPVEVTEEPTFVRIAESAGLFVNSANAYLSAFASYEAGEILVVRGLLPTFPDTGAGESVVGDFDVRYLSITSNSNVKPYPTVDGVYDAELPLDANGYYTVVVARSEDLPVSAAMDPGIVTLGWGANDAQTVIVRNMLPSADFPEAIQDVTPSDYGAPSDAAQVMGAYYPGIVACSRTLFDSGGAQGCFEAAGVPYPGN